MFKVQEVDENENEVCVKFLEAAPGMPGTYRWPRKDDIAWTEMHTVIRRLAPPVIFFTENHETYVFDYTVIRF